MLKLGQQNKKPSVWQVVSSVLSAFFGVQSRKVQERDFNQGQPWWVYVITGLILVVILIALLIGMVKVLLYYLH